MTALLVGEDNPYGSDPRYALWCAPRFSAGGRLCFDILGLSGPKDYIKQYDRVNLCASKWSMAEARKKVLELLLGEHRVHVLLGAKVCRAYDVEFKPFEITKQVDGDRAWTFVILPHPSGRNRMWNEPGALERARRVVEEALK